MTSRDADRPDSADPDAAGARGADPDAAGARVADAVAVMARARRDGDWESAQTHDSLLSYLIEESWEFVDAVDDGDRDELVSELGDLLLQVLFHAAIGAEREDDPFTIDDVAGSLLDKLRRRAPYWFTDTDTDTGAAAAAIVPARAAAGPDAAEQDRLWQEAKKAERAGRPPRGVVDGIPWGMPALALGQKVLARVRAAGIPGDLVPPGMTVVRVGGEGDADDMSAEVAYRREVRRFAEAVRTAEARLAVAATEATPGDWRAAWPG